MVGQALTLLDRLIHSRTATRIISIQTCSTQTLSQQPLPQKIKSNCVISLLATFMVVLCLQGCSSTPSTETNRTIIGVVQKASGYPTVLRRSQTYILAEQAKIFEGDVIETDEVSKVSLEMLDGTTFALGPHSHFVVHAYRYSESDPTPEARLSFTSGSLRTKTAALMKARKPQFEIKTPLAVIGVRGTDFWSGFIFGDNTLDVAMIEGTGIYIQNDHGSEDINDGGFGTTVIGGSAPQPPKQWSQVKINRALSLTAQ